MLQEFDSAGWVFWLIVILVVLGAFGYAKEKLRKRKLEIDMQRKLDRGLER